MPSIFLVPILLCFQYYAAAQILSQDSLIYPSEYQEPKLPEDINWLTNSIILHDSLINYIAIKAEQEIKRTNDAGYTYKIILGIITLESDPCYQVILNNMMANFYVDYTDGIKAYSQTKSYPVIKAINSSSAKSVIGLKNYIIQSGYLERQISEEEIKLLNYLLIRHDPTFLNDIDLAIFNHKVKANLDAIIKFKTSN